MSQTSKSGLTQAPFQFGPSQFDIQSILNSLSGNDQAITNRYAQLGLEAPGGGPSTMQQQDLSQQNLIANAAKGQLQTAEVNNPAFNPALQTPTLNQQGTVLGSGIGGAAQGATNLLSTG